MGMKHSTMRSKPRFTIRAIFYRDDKPIRTVRTTKKMRVLHFAQVTLWDSAYLRVTYNARLGYHNEWDCRDLEDFQKTLSLFTEQSLLEYAEGKDGD